MLSAYTPGLKMYTHLLEDLPFTSGGKGILPEEIARTLYDAVKQYADSDRYLGCLKRVTIVTYKQGVLGKFVSAIKMHTGQTQAKRRFSCKNQL